MVSLVTPATGKALRHSLLENSASWSTLPAVTPMTLAPMAANSGVATANSCASAVQPEVKAEGKKYSTTRPPLERAVDSLNGIGLPARKAVVVKSGAWAPTFSAAKAGAAASAEPARRERARAAATRRFMVGLPVGRIVRPSGATVQPQGYSAALLTRADPSQRQRVLAQPSPFRPQSPPAPSRVTKVAVRPASARPQAIGRAPSALAKPSGRLRKTMTGK